MSEEEIKGLIGCLVLMAIIINPIIGFILGFIWVVVETIMRFKK